MQNVNYPGMIKLLQKYGSYGFQVLAFPCNQFGAQAPCSSDCESAYLYHKLGGTASTFPTMHVFDKVDVIGPGSLEAFTIVQHGGGPGKEIGWNYAKFLVDGDGELVESYAPIASPIKAEAHIRRLLKMDDGEEPNSLNALPEVD